MKKFIILVGIACSVGMMYAISTLKGMPDAFDWESDDE
jgi:hypothetical protein